MLPLSWNMFIIMVSLVILSLMALLSTLPITIYIMKHKNPYEKGGYLYSWYDRTYKRMGYKWIIEVYEEIIKQKLLCFDNNEFVFISPSGNKGKYEEKLFEYISNKGIKNKFIVSDKNYIENHEESKSLEKGTYIYKEKYDAINIKDTLKEEGISAVDIVWDLRGLLWYTLDKPKKNPLTKDVFEVYKNVLKDNGFIIVDNIEVTRYKAKLNNFIFSISGLKFGYEERSTYQFLCELMENNEGFKNYLNDNFLKHKIYSESNSKIGMVILKKV